MKIRFNQSKKRNLQHGQGMVEFALAFPILLVLILGVFEIGRMVYIYNAVLTASREAARYGSAGDSDAVKPRYQDCAGIRETAKRMGGLANLQDDDILIHYDSGPGTATIASSCPPGVEINGGVDRVVVTVSSNFQPLVGLTGLSPVPIQSTVARTIILKIKVP